MADYEAEHGIKPTTAKPTQITRPDMSTFYAHLDQITSGSSGHAVPEPNELLAAYRLVEDGFERIRNDQPEDSPLREQLNSMITNLFADFENESSRPKELDGVPDSFLDDHMIPVGTARKKFKESDSCPICSDAFLDEPKENNILAIRLPCHKDHVFHKECIGPWLKLKRTCPLDRSVIYEKKKPLPVVEDPDEGEYDDMYS